VADWETVRELGVALPGVEESMSYGTPALKVAGKMFVRLRPELDLPALVVRVDPMERDFLLQADPETYFVTPHYDGYPYVLVRLDRIAPGELRELLTESWLGAAPKRLHAELHPAESGG
jgi:hypothetical protein